jgi:hypothetical protein
VNGFDEYAALARELSTRRRGGDRAVAAEADRRRALHATLDRLGDRLAAQGQRLDRLGEAIGRRPAPAAAPSAVPDGTGPAAAGDPATDLAAAARLADEADRHGHQAEALARRPALLPTWSPAPRAVAVYASCALIGSLLMMAALIGSSVPLTGLDVVAAASCAGVPLLSFLAGHLVLGRWGRPVLGDETPPGRYVPLGFVICALVAPTLFCAYLVLFRLLR